jgi:C-methyltransferase
MDAFSNNEAAAILGAYSFSDVKSIIDVGSGRGALLGAILQAYPQLVGAALDMPSEEGDCTRRFDEAGLSGRAAFVAGNFFRSLPAGYDLYFLKSVLHNWDDNSVGRFLKSVVRLCRQPRACSS